MAGKYKTYTPEFREEVAKMVIETSRAIADVAREYGLKETTVGNWVRATALNFRDLRLFSGDLTGRW